MTLLDRTPLQLWAWIVIIVAGSLCVIGIAATALICYLRRRKVRQAEIHDDDLMPVRRVTVRRGRVVPASHYLSLTGSKFGLNQFDEESVRTRNRSPFEWWNTIREPKEKKHEIYTRHDYAQSTASLTPEKRLTAPSMREIESPLPSPIPPLSPTMPHPTARPSRHTSFSRPFSITTHIPDSPLMTQPLHSRNLSKIDEADSPHNSMISNRSTHQRSLRSTRAVTGDASRQDSRRPSYNSSTRLSARGRTAAGASSSSLPEGSTRVPIAYNGSRTNLGEPEPRPSLSNKSSDSIARRSLSHHSSDISRRDSVAEDHQIPTSTVTPQHHYQPYDLARRQSWGRKHPNNPSSETDSQYSHVNNWADLRPISTNASLNRSSSKKGNVLRKKSLRRQQVVSMVGT